MKDYKKNKFENVRTITFVYMRELKFAHNNEHRNYKLLRMYDLSY
jgi:hypothetical protein